MMTLIKPIRLNVSEFHILSHDSIMWLSGPGLEITPDQSIHNTTLYTFLSLSQYQYIFIVIIIVAFNQHRHVKTVKL